MVTIRCVVLGISRSGVCRAGNTAAASGPALLSLAPELYLRHLIASHNLTFHFSFLAVTAVSTCYISIVEFFFFFFLVW